MRCSRINKRIMAYHDGELTETWSRRVEKHILSCSLCEKALKDLEAADQGIAVPDPGNEYWNGFTARVMDRVKNDPVVAQTHTKLKEPGRFWENRRLAPVFSLALVVVVATGLLIEIRGPIAPRQKMPAVQKQAVEADFVVDGTGNGQVERKDNTVGSSMGAEKGRVGIGQDMGTEESETGAIKIITLEPAPAAGTVPVLEEAGRANGTVRMEKQEPAQTPKPQSVPVIEVRSIPMERQNFNERVVIAEPETATTTVREVDPKPSPGAAKPSAPQEDKYLKDDADSGELLSAQGEYALDQTYGGDYEGSAFRKKEVLIEDDEYGKGSLRSMMIKAEALSREGRQAESEKVLKELLSQSPPSPIQEEATLLLVQVLQYQNRSVEARKLLTEAQNIYPENDMVQEFRLEAAPTDLTPAQ